MTMESIDTLDTIDTALARDRAALLIIDYQERLSAAMPDEINQRATRNICTLIEMARRFSVPVIISRQYPKGLGDTVADIENALAHAGDATDVHRFDKVDFSVCRVPDFISVSRGLNERDQWIVTGMEAHVCVYQSVRQLVRAQKTVHVVSDAVVSRAKANWRVGLDMMARAGALITSTEVVVFDMLERAGSDDFKALSRLIR